MVQRDNQYQSTVITKSICPMYDASTPTIDAHHFIIQSYGVVFFNYINSYQLGATSWEAIIVAYENFEHPLVNVLPSLKVIALALPIRETGKDYCFVVKGDFAQTDVVCTDKHRKRNVLAYWKGK